MPCEEELNYVDVQSLSEENLPVIQPPPTAVSAAIGLSPTFSTCSLPPSKPNTPSTEALSALLTEGFLEPKRISLGLAPSEQSGQHMNMQTLVPPLASYATALASSAGSSANPTPSLRRQHRRQSSTTAAVSWNETVSIKRSPLKQNVVKTWLPEQLENGRDNSPLVVSQSAEREELVTMREKSLHRRHQSMGNANYSLDEAQRPQRSSNLSGARDEAALSAAQRPHSWGPVGTAYYMESLMCAFYEPALLHGPCIG